MPVSQVITRGLGPTPAPPHWIITAGLGGDAAPPDTGGATSGGRVKTTMTITGLLALSRMLDILLAGDAFLTVTVHLYTDTALVLVPTLEPTDFTEADFDGYADQPLVVTGPVKALNPEGDLVYTFPHANFVPTGTTTPNTVYGWWMEGLVDGVGAVVIAAGRFDEPMVVVGPFTPVQVEPRFPWGQPRGN